MMFSASNSPLGFNFPSSIIVSDFELKNISGTTPSYDAFKILPSSVISNFETVDDSALEYDSCTNFPATRTD